ncbi:GNAT family N-acetyltransferase [Acidisoma cellulosilytica]|uniref:GNAT family N-acetyltransferase n=1 Tax=Acidisoma cellulosilyticum TaxID=2802395 RepID=A0A963Z3I0_9PROT|nr:GNAT family N-acetyltransferase [Acidisoma cellulosilyticum]MCB8881829.1 GNAT family N-acetyltransferase [Acidisoma cellulosilyticum]
MIETAPGPWPELRTSRLRLRFWEARDAAPFAAQNADEETMRFLGGPMTRAQSDAYIIGTREQWSRDGFGKWVVELAETGEFVGALGLQRMRFDADFTPAVEIAWRMTRSFWGLGYATEAARAAVAFGFETLKLDEILALTVPQNLASRAVMERLGMRLSREFDHPLLPHPHPLCRHVLYRLGQG